MREGQTEMQKIAINANWLHSKKCKRHFDIQSENVNQNKFI